MKKWIAALVGFMATVLGTLIVIPRINDTIWRVQLVLNEFPYVVTVLAASAALRPKRHPLAAVLGAWGAVLSIVPLTRIRHALRDMDESMRDGFGRDYQARIPPTMKLRLARSRLSLSNIAGRAYRQNRCAVINDVPFFETSTRTLRLDIYRPLVVPGDDRPLYPAIVMVHGGAWMQGDKGEYFDAHNRYLSSQGYVIFDIQYRFTTHDSARWPTQLEDVRAAVRWVKAHARTWHVDTSRIALYGRSAGGHLVLQAAYRAQAEFADTAVAAVVSVYPPTDLRLTGPRHSEAVLALLAGTSYQVPEAYSDASPLNFVRDDLPPTLLLHGAMDTLVGPVHSELLLNRLRATNTPVGLLRVPWGRHGFDVFMNGLGGQITQYYVDRFLAWSLYAK